MPEKSADAFRTISEVAEQLAVPQHVLRFWETRFDQIKPVKRVGGRRYYRPGDILLIDAIRKLLHDDGLTIRGVQKLLAEQGVEAVAGQSRFAARPPAPPAPPERPARPSGPPEAAPPNRPRRRARGTTTPDNQPELPFAPPAAPPPAPPVPLALRLRRLPPGALAPYLPRLRALQVRLASHRARLLAAAAGPAPGADP